MSEQFKGELPEQISSETKKEIKESKEEVLYIDKVIMQAEQPYPKYGMTKELTSEQIKEEYENALKHIEDDIKKYEWLNDKRLFLDIFQNMGELTKDLLKYEAVVKIYEKMGDIVGAWVNKKFTGISEKDLPTSYKKIQKMFNGFLDRNDENVLEILKESGVEEKNIKEAKKNFYLGMNIIQLTSGGQENIETIDEYNEELGEAKDALEIIVGKKLNELTEKEIDNYSELIKKYYDRLEKGYETKTVREFVEEVRDKVREEMKK